MPNQEADQKTIRELHDQFMKTCDLNHQARTTEIWQRMDDDWRLVHFHCSDDEPDAMGGF